MARVWRDPVSALAAVWLAILLAAAVWPTTNRTDFAQEFILSTQSIVFTSLSAMVIAILPGLAIGLTSGFAPPWARRAFETLEAVWGVLPATLIALILLVALGPSPGALVVATAAVAWPRVSRPACDEVRAFAQSALLDAARVAGLPRRAILLREIGPALAPRLLLAGADCLALAVMVQVVLGVILPASLPTSWGAMIAVELAEAAPDPLRLCLPLLAFCITLLSLARIGRTLRHLSDPVRR